MLTLTYGSTSREKPVIPREGVESLLSGAADGRHGHAFAPSVIPREGVESYIRNVGTVTVPAGAVIPREGVERYHL